LNHEGHEGYDTKHTKRKAEENDITGMVFERSYAYSNYLLINKQFEHARSFVFSLFFFVIFVVQRIPFAVARGSSCILHPVSCILNF